MACLPTWVRAQKNLVVWMVDVGTCLLYAEIQLRNWCCLERLLSWLGAYCGEGTVHAELFWNGRKASV